MPAEIRRRTRAATAMLVWAPHEEEAWVPCTVKAEEGEKVILSVEGFSSKEQLVLSKSQFKDLSSALPEHEAGIDDVCSLPSVPEGALLHTVRIRYRRNEIYTRVARTVIAINPFCSLPIYSSQCIDQYMAASDSLDLPPHIFGLSKDALHGIRKNRCNQAVLISGESGAGKTESAKLILSFVADAVRGAQSSGKGFAEKVLQTNPVLEAFGNAMTVRNNNSSRFGKWLDLGFSGVGGTELTGCRLTSYLLETTRVCTQASDERGFHVFFHMLQARNSSLLAGLDLQDPSHYRYIKGGQRTAPGIDDGECFEELCEALTTVGFSEEARIEIFRVVAGVLLLGNCEFDPKHPEAATLMNEETLLGTAKHFGVAAETLKDCLLVRKLYVGKDMTRAPLRLEQAQAARDALARLLYGELFLHLISRMNESLAMQRQGGGGDERLLGILDIAGFESFETNSLEQLMINLSNENLQQHFNSVVLKDELLDCEREQVPVPDGLTFEDNIDSVSLIDGKGGILDLLDETMGMPGASNQSFVTYVLKQHKGHRRIVTSKIARLGFGIAHYAGDVMYSCDGWLEKNANNPPDAAMEMLSASSLSCFNQIYQVLKQQEATSSRSTTVMGKAKAKTKSATMCFRVSLRSLGTKLGESQSHFMRCVKPNKEKVPGKFVGKMVMDQLSLSGVLSTVHIRRKGYAHRIPLADFYAEYRCISSRPIYIKEVDEKQLRKEVESLLIEVGDGKFPTGSFAIGLTKVFGRSEAIRALDAARREAEGRRAVVIQRHVRGREARRLTQPLNEARNSIRDFLTGLRLDTQAAPLRKATGEQPGKKIVQRTASQTRRLSMWFGGSVLELLGSQEKLEESLAQLDVLVGEAAMVGLDNADFLAAERTKLRMRRELEASKALEDPELKKCMDPVTLDKVLARARGQALPRWETMTLLEERLGKLHMQLPLQKALRAALARDDTLQECRGGQEAIMDDENLVESMEHLYEVDNAVEEAGLDDVAKWLPELDGPKLYAEVSRRIAAAEAAEEARAKAAEEAQAAAEAAKAAAERAAAQEEQRGEAASVVGQVTSTSSSESSVEATVSAAPSIRPAGDLAPISELSAFLEEGAAPEEEAKAGAAPARDLPSTEAAPARLDIPRASMSRASISRASMSRASMSRASMSRASMMGKLKSRMSLSGMGIPEMEQLREAMRKATDEYDADGLEAALRQAERSGLRDEECAPLVAARQAFESLQAANFVVATLEKTEREAREPNPSLVTLRRLENLIRQLKCMSGHEAEVAEASETMQAAMVQRCKSSGRKSLFLSTDPEEVKLGSSTFASLSQFSRLKSTKAWAGRTTSVRGSLSPSRGSLSPSRGSLSPSHGSLSPTMSRNSSRDDALCHSKVCIEAAMTRAPPGMDEEEYEAGAIQNFRNILVAMGDRPAQACQRKASKDSVLAVAHLEPNLRAEVYVQLLKQVSGNLNPRSLRLGWELLHGLCLDAAPPPEVAEFVRAAFREAAADPDGESAGMANACLALLNRPEGKLRLLGADAQDQISLESAQRLSAVSMVAAERARHAQEVKHLKEEMARIRGSTGRKGTNFWSQFCMRCGDR